MRRRGGSLSLILQPLHQLVSSNVGSRLAAHLDDRLMVVCVSPSGIGQLERPELANDLTMARDFDLGMMGPPLDISMLRPRRMGHRPLHRHPHQAL